jgi:hypothetical protein
MIKFEPANIAPARKWAEGMKLGTPLNRIALRMTASFMSGPIELRFPELFTSAKGTYYLDHFHPDHPPLFDLEPFPEWSVSPEKTRCEWKHQFPDGLEIRGSAETEQDAVTLKFELKNGGTETLRGLYLNPCLMMKPAPEFSDARAPEYFYAHMENGLQPFHEIAPELAPAGSRPWLLFLTPSGREHYPGPKESSTWKLSSARLASNLMVAATGDHQHLIGYAWRNEDHHCMSNGGIPCLHTGPGAIATLAPGKTKMLEGRLWFLPFDPKELVNQFERWKGSAPYE